MHNKQHMIHVANVEQHADHLLKMQPGSACSSTDVAMLGNLKNCHVEMACKHRCCTLDHGIVSAMAEPPVVPDIKSTVYNTFPMPVVAKAQLVIHDQHPIIGLHTETLPLPISGLFSDRPLEDVDVALERCKQTDYDRSVHPGVEPFMTLSFSSLPIIPHLRLTTLGIFDVDRLKLV